jgi:hypothetical protein
MRWQRVGWYAVMVARDRIEPPAPAFSGPPGKLTKWSGISDIIEMIRVVA